MSKRPSQSDFSFSLFCQTYSFNDVQEQLARQLLNRLFSFQILHVRIVLLSLYITILKLVPVKHLRNGKILEAKCS